MIVRKEAKINSFYGVKKAFENLLKPSGPGRGGGVTWSVRVVGNPEAHEAPTLAGLLRPP
jgi:hypothetical protein